ncbi:MAG: transaldolase [Candidatus Eiseniibacteriota bacterium]
MPSRAEQLQKLGQSVWFDFIRRGHLRSGEFERLVRDSGVVGVTSNPTIFQQAIAGSGDYDEAITRGAAAGLSGPELFEALAVEDIQLACDLLAPVAARTHALDGRVSIEVSPRLAHDTARTVEEALRLHREVARPNVMVKVPATAAGLPAIAELTGRGLSINVTLIFSLTRYEQVMDAYLSGLERLVAGGGNPASVHSVASFFVSRVDSKVDAAIDARIAAGAPREELAGLKGRAAVANARLAYARFREVFGGARFQTLSARGAHLQRPLWASTSTKNPAYPDTLYVDELIGADTVNTMPLATLQAFNDHGVLESRIGQGLDSAGALFRRLPELGVTLDALIAQLEGEGVEAFLKSYEALLETLESRRATLSGKSAS